MSKTHNTKGQISEGKSRIKRGVIASSVLAICFSVAGALAPAHACMTQTQCNGYYASNPTPATPQYSGYTYNASQTPSNSANNNYSFGGVYAPNTTVATPQYGGNNTQSSGGQFGVQYGGAFGPLSGQNIRLRLQFDDLAPQRNGDANQFNQRQNSRGANLQWSQGLTSFNPSVNQSRQVNPVRVRGYGPNGLNQIPLLNSHRGGSKKGYRRDLLINVTPRFVNER